jgi:hypothetical protein
LEFPGLKEIWVEYWIAGDGIDDDQQPEAVEAIRKRIEGLNIEARKVGIDLEVRVDRRNKINLA